MNNAYSYRVELANEIRGGRAVGNLFGVAKLINGCRGGWVLEPQKDQQKARDFADAANLIERGRQMHADESARWAATECEHEDEVERLREEEWESDYAADPSGQTDSGPCGPEPEVY